MPTAEIITIGTEILLGEIIDTNAPYIARCLKDLGVDLYRKTSVGDNPRRIAQAIQQAMERSDVIITTGGLGPTVDDPTREAVALAMGVPLEYRPELWEQIQSRFKRYGRSPTENNRRQAYIPQGSTAVENKVGTAPAFIATKEVESREVAVFSLPGVPSEMEYLVEYEVIPYLKGHFHLHGLIKARLLHTAGVGESLIDELVGDLEEFSNPTVGLAAHSGQVDVRITAKAGSEAEADRMIQEMEDQVRSRLGKWIYGVDQETLEQVAVQALKRKDWSLCVVEAGLGGELTGRLASEKTSFLGGEVLTSLPGPDELYSDLAAYRHARHADAGLGVALIPGDEKQELHLIMITPDGEQRTTRTYGGPPAYGPRWAINHSLDILRNI
jgi:nicotinamide-nucleotide amidase